MISREELRQLAQFECRHPGEFACTFYFAPGTPQDKSHREEAIRAKDLVRKTLQGIELNGRARGAVADLDRILRLAESLHGNQARAKAVFACSARNVWQDFDLPPGPFATRLFLNRRFHLKPLAALLSDYPRLWVALVDRQSARFLEIDLDGVKEQGSFTNPVPRRGRSDGYAGYNGGHAERHVEDEVRRHFRAVGDFLKNASDRSQFDALVFGCHEVNCPDLEAQLSPELKKKILGRFSADVSSLSNEKAAEEACRIRADALLRHHQSLLAEAVNEARSNGRGVTGLRRVLRAVELHEVDTILMAQDYSARAVECVNCRHLDSHLVRYCPVCGRATRPLDDVCEALVPLAVQNNLGLVLLPEAESLDKIGNIAALLRFRADRNTNDLRAAS
jgi:peptide subunit release factor 1 (eRF1)